MAAILRMNKIKINAWRLRVGMPKKKKGVILNLPVRGTGLPCTDKRAHARVVSNLPIVSGAKITSFLTETPSESFKFYLIEESQNY